MSDKEKLEKYEKALNDIKATYDECAEELAKLKAAGQMKSVKFRETLGRKLIISNILMIFKTHGIEKDN